MYSPNPSGDICHETLTQFTAGLPLLPPLSPLILGSLHTFDFAQWYQQDLEYSGMKPIPSSNPQVGPSSDTAPREHDDRTLNHNDTDIKDKNTVINPLRLELATELSARENSSAGQFSAVSQDDSGPSSTCSELNSAVMHLPPLHDVGAFHANACIVEMLAPAMHRGSSHRAEVLCTTDIGSENCIDVPTSLSSNSVIDLEFLSFSPVFSSLNDNALLSPSWKLELTLSSSWHLAAESAINLSQPITQGSSLVRRPATRRKGVADPDSPKIPLRKSHYMNKSGTLLDLSHKRPSPESGILRAMNSPVLKSHGYRVRFLETERRRESVS